MGSASEVEYLFMLANSLDFIENIQYNELNEEIVEIKKMLTSFIKDRKSVVQGKNAYPEGPRITKKKKRR